MISKERDNELKALALLRIKANEPNWEAHELAVKLNSGKGTAADRKRFDKMMEDPDVGGKGLVFFLADKEEADRVDHHYLMACNNGLGQYIEKQEPDTVRGRKQLETCKNNAVIGGTATAHYTDAQVTQAFTDYKRRNHDKSVWQAANALIRPGAALAKKWHHVNSPWNRIGRIAEKGMGITREQWYNDL